MLLVLGLPFGNYALEWKSCRSLVKLGSLVAILSIPKSQFFFLIMPMIVIVLSSGKVYD